MILNLKYRRWRILAECLAELLVASYILAEGGADLVVPVPLHWRRSWQRGFNQAETLGRKVARRLSIPFAEPLIRRRFTRQQFGLIKSVRRNNVRGAFSFRRGLEKIVSGKIVLIVDDVVATGSTIEECAKILKQKGAKQVWGLVVARA